MENISADIVEKDATKQNKLISVVQSIDVNH